VQYKTVGVWTSAGIRLGGTRLDVAPPTGVLASVNLSDLSSTGPPLVTEAARRESPVRMRIVYRRRSFEDDHVDAA
jgi:hypothetical protein